MSTSTDKRKAEPEPVMGDDVLAEDEVLERTCPGCNGTVEVTIPKGSSLFTAKMMRRFEVMCTPCAEEDDRREREREMVRIRERNVERCGLPRELRALTWDTYDESRRGAAGAKLAAQAWAKGEHEKLGVMLAGPVGVGKTRLAATACWAACGEYGHPLWRPKFAEDTRPLPGTAVKWVNVADLIARLAASFGDKDRAEALKVLTGRGGIVLDDLDKINPTQQVLAHLYTAIDNRITAGAPLFVTTNLMPGELRDKLAVPGRNEDPEARAVIADSIVSRLAGYCTVRGIKGEDGRRS